MNCHWVIPETIHTIPQVASWNSEEEGGFLGLEFQRRGGGGGNAVWNSKGMGGMGSALNLVNFRREDGESFA